MSSSESIQMTETELLIAKLEKENYQLRESNRNLQSIIDQTAVAHAKVGTALGNVSKQLRETKETLKYYEGNAKEYLRDYLITAEPVRKEKGLI